MDALTKKRLKTLQLTDWASVIEDINYNFSVLLSSPLFVGLQGDAGAQGASGPAGIRGSKWMFVDVDNFRTNFPDDNINGAFDITQQYLTAKLQNASARQALIKSLGAGTLLVDGDIIVSNSRILMVDLENNRVIDTGESINGNQDVFIQTMQRQIKSLVDEYLRNNTDLDNIRQTVSAVPAIAKNYEDSSSLGINNTFHKTSILDIPMGIATSDTGVVRGNNMLFYPSESVISPDTKLAWIFGSRDRYHEMCQNQLGYATRSSSNTTSEYSPNDNNMPALVILQNDNASGVIIGSKSAKNFTQFGRWYMNSENKMVFTSSWLPEKLKCSQFIIGNDDMEFVASLIKLLGNVIVSGNLTIKDGYEFISQFLKIDEDGQVSTGQPGKLYEILSNVISLPNLSECEGKFLTLKNSLISPAEIQLMSVNESISAIPNDPTQIVTANYLLWLINLFCGGLNIEDIGTVEGETGLFERLRNRIAALETLHKNEFNSLKENVSTCVNGLTAIRGTVSSHDTSISNLSRSISSLSSDVSATNTNIGELSGDFIKLKSDVESKIKTSEEDTEKKFIQVRRELNTTKEVLAGDIKTLQSQVSTLNSGNFRPVPGTIIDLWVDSALEFLDLLDKMFDVNGKGKVNAKYDLMGKVITADLSDYYVCDGRSGTPDLTNVVLAMASSQHKTSTSEGKESLLLSNDEIPVHKHKVPSGSYNTNEDSHVHRINLNTSDNGDHVHDIKYKNLARFGANQGDMITFTGENRWSGVMDGSGDHHHTVNGNTESSTHSHIVEIPEQETSEQHEITQKEISILQPTKYCIKMMYIGKTE